MTDVRRRDDLLEQALDLPEESRPAFLDQACGDDHDLRREVERLLAVDADGWGDFLEAGAFERTTCVPGTVIDRYVVKSQIGAGGMGVVYRAHDPEIGRDVALKIMTRFRTSAERRRLALAEVQALGRLRHHGIVHIYTVGEYRRRPFFVMELLEGRDLAGAMAENSSVAVEQKLNWLCQLAESLRAVHAAGIVHRDVKPSNVFLTSDGYIKLLDFGIARRLDKTLSHATAVSGTPAYMAPEQRRGERATQASDIYAFGVVLGELLTGRGAGGDGGAQGARGLTALPPVTALAQVAPPGIVDLYRRMTAPEPADRIQSFGEVLGVLADAQGGPVRTRTRWKTVVALLGLMAVVGAGALWSARSTPEPSAPAAAITDLTRVRVTLFTDAGVEQPAAITGQPVLLRTDDRFGLRVSATESGHLYLLGKSVERGSLHVLFPSTTSNAGSSILSGDAVVRVPEESWFFFDERPGTERMWIVWSRQPHRQLERASRWANEHDQGEVRDATERKELEGLLATASPRALITRGELLIEGAQDVLMGFIDLRHELSPAAERRKDER
jgi:hypothetical protein